MPLFDVAIIEHPTKKEAEDGKSEKLVFGPKTVVAKDQQAAAIAAVLDGTLDKDVSKDRMEVLVRPW